jgi:hypothetical protein
MRPHRRASLLSFFCCQTVRSLNALHFRICDVSSESTSIESLADRFAGAWLQLSESFSGHSSTVAEIVAIVCAIAVSRRERFTSCERVRQSVACGRAFSTSNPKLHGDVAAVSENFRWNPSIRVRRHPCSQRLQIGPPGWTRLRIRRYRFVARLR